VRKVEQGKVPPGHLTFFGEKLYDECRRRRLSPLSQWWSLQQILWLQGACCCPREK